MLAMDAVVLLGAMRSVGQTKSSGTPALCSTNKQKSMCLNKKLAQFMSYSAPQKIRKCRSSLDIVT